MIHIRAMQIVSQWPWLKFIFLGKRKWMLAGILSSVLVLLLVLKYALGTDVKTTPSSTENSAQPEVVAVVDGQTITYADIRPLVEAGIDRAIAVDRTLNKVLVANAAKTLFPQEAKVAIQTAEWDLLSALFLRLKREQIQSMISEASINDFYEKNITPQQFDTYKIKYYLTRDRTDADQVRALLLAGDKGALDKLEYFNKDTPYISLAMMPYNLGKVVKEGYNPDTKGSVVLGPIMIRDGFVIVMVESYKPGNRPELTTELKARIREQLIENGLSVVLTELRASAKINIK